MQFFEDFNVDVPSSYSFPSGHTGNAFAVAMALTLMMKKKSVAIPAFILAFLIGISRLYLCVHYPTDVLAGIVVGCLCGVGGYFIYLPVEKAVLKAVENHKKKKQE